MIMLLQIPAPTGAAIALIIFIVASITDKLDGYIARKYDMITILGKFLDPLADKLLIISAIVCFGYFKLVNPYIAVLIISRELIITSFRVVAIGIGITLSADKWGKIKTALQMIACSAVMIGMIWSPISLLGDILMYVATIATILSGINYITKNWKAIKGN
jgi:CDP-diacylglycerol--glycerol-3-phosphate 3-phosphatidyltransferase